MRSSFPRRLCIAVSTILAVAGFCLNGPSAFAQVSYPQFVDTGNPAQDQANYNAALAQYDQQKAASVAASRRAGAVRSTRSDAGQTSSIVSTARQSASASCIIARDASWTKLALGDDNSSAAIPLGWTFNLYGVAYNTVYVNNNGNLTFASASGGYTAEGFPLAGTPMVAPFWADVDTRGTTAAGCGGVYYKNFGTRFIVTWEGVGYYPQACDKSNTFQVVISNGTDPVVGVGLNVKFNYGDMNWTTGSASGGSGGFGGTPATAGVNKGADNAFVQIGRFGVVGVAYDGGGGNTDGVDYLDYECYSFNVSNADNIPPSLQGLPANNTLTLNCGQTSTFNISSQGPEVTQTTTISVNNNGMCGVTSSVNNSASPGGVSTATITITAGSCNSGTNTIIINATDNGTPSRTTSATLTVVVADNTPPTITCPGNITLASCETTIPDYTMMAVKSDNCSDANAIVVTQSPAAGTSIASGATVNVTLTARDGAGNSAPCTFAVTRPNVTPVANDDAAAVCAGSSVTINVLQNDAHPQGDPLTINDHTEPSVGTVTRNADNTLTYTAPAGYSGPVTFTYSTKAADATLGFSGNGHYYEWVPFYGVTWTQARQLASQRYYNGLQGYLVTITSQQEMDFVATKLQGSGWMGASDLAYEGTWRWVTGPEGLEEMGAGRHFSNQDKYDGCGAYQAPGINGYYANWADGEPNDCGANVNQYGATDQGRGGEHYAHFYAGGIWNDYPNSVGGNIQGYVVEYGGLEGCIPQLTDEATVTIMVNALPETQITASATAICPGGTATLTATGADSYQWNNGATGATLVVNAPGTYSAVGSSNGCSTSSNAITITANTPASVGGVNPYIQASTNASSCDATVNYSLSFGGNPAPAVNYSFSGATLGGGMGTGSGNVFNKGITHVVITAANDCNMATASFDITVVDDVKPTARCKPVTVYLDATGQASVSASQVDAGSDDNCGPVSLSVSREGTLCATAAENGTITMTAPAGTVIDRIDFASYGTPNGFCGNFSLGGCHSSLSLSRVQNAALGRNSFTIVANNSTFGDPCFGTVKRLYIQAHYTSAGGPTTFDCSSLGANNTVTLLVTDASGNASSCTAQVTVLDAIRPEITTPAGALDRTVECSDAGAIADALSLRPQGTDNCAIQIELLSDMTTPGCGSTWTRVRQWRYVDASGNASDVYMQTISAIDTQAPALMVGNVMSANDAGRCGAIVQFAAQASDNCSQPSISYSQNPGTFFPVGSTTVTATATDACGNHTSESFVVTVSDTEAPMVHTQNLTIQLDASGAASITPAQVDNGSTDNCAIASMSLDIEHFNCSNTGANTVTLTVTDIHGNSSSATAVITVQDVTSPVVTNAAGDLDRTVECSDPAGIAAALALAPQATDACQPVTIHLVSDVTTANCGTTYSRVRQWNFTDPSGNTSATFTQTIQVVDRTAPVVTVNAGAIEHCFDTTANNYPVPAISATDNCNSFTYSYVVKNQNGGTVRSGSGNNASGAFPVGMNTVYWSVTDACGNVGTAQTTVRINAPITAGFSSFQAAGGNANTLYTSEYAPAASANITITANGGTPGYSYAWSIESGTAATILSGAATATITVKAVGSGTVVLRAVVTDNKGCQAVFRKTIRVIDARCGNKNDKVLVCHGTGSASNPWVQICVAPSAVPAQLGNGSYLGACTGATTRTIQGVPETEVAADASVLAYPNPSRGLVQLRVSGLKGMLQLSVVDSRGTTVLRRAVTAGAVQETLQLDLQGVAGGLYTVRVSDGKRTLSTRVVIAR